jgi:ribosomal protein S18 acetylase RimI-like enzyme
MTGSSPVRPNVEKHVVASALMAGRIRPMTLDDIPGVARLHAVSWRTAYRGVLAQAFLDRDLDEDRRVAWAARRDEIARGAEFGFVFESLVGGEARAMGFAYVLPNTDATYGHCLDNLHVAPEGRGLGIGGHLLSAVAQALQVRGGHRGLHLWVYSANTRAQQFYARHGASRRESALLEAADGRQVSGERYAWDDVRRVGGAGGPGTP